MQLRSDFNAAPAIRAPGPVDAPARTDGVAEARQQGFQRAMSGLLGKSVSAAVVARLPDGQFVVNVAGNAARMMLPPGTQPGTDVLLTLISNNPRPTFQVTAGDGTELPATVYLPPGSTPGAAVGAALSGRAAAGLAQAAAMQAAATATAGQGGGEPGAGTLAPAISEAGRIISSVLVAAGQGRAAGAVRGTEALLGQGAPDPAQLAGKLQQTVAHSGLFYESHLAEWADGARSMSELLRDPQTARAPTPATDPAIAQFINLQLTSHEQSRVAWQGQLMPGQDLHWEIEKDAAQGRGTNEDEAPTWRSGLRFRLPLLGDISATVVLHGEHCQIEIQAPSSGIGSVLRAHAARLETALEAAGTPLTALSIGNQRESVDD